MANEFRSIDREKTHTKPILSRSPKANKRPKMVKQKPPPSTHPAQTEPTNPNLGIGQLTLYQRIQNNLICAGRQSYHQRIIFAARHKNVAVSMSGAGLKECFSNLVHEANRDVDADKLTGLALIGDTHTIQMVEGSEECIGKFMWKLANASEELFRASRMILVYNNANRVSVECEGLFLKRFLVIFHFFLFFFRIRDS